MSNGWQLSDSETAELWAMKGKLIGYFKRRVKYDDIDNLTTDTLIEAGARFERRSSLWHFVFSIARRQVAGYWRAKNRRRGRGELVPIEDDHMAEFAAIPESSPALESVLSVPARRVLLRDALGGVPDVYRDVVTLWCRPRRDRAR